MREKNIKIVKKNKKNIVAEVETITVKTELDNLQDRLQFLNDLITTLEINRFAICSRHIVEIEQAKSRIKELELED